MRYGVDGLTDEDELVMWLIASSCSSLTSTALSTAAVHNTHTAVTYIRVLQATCAVLINLTQKLL